MLAAVTWSRRELLAGLGVASASAIVAACGGSVRRPEHADAVHAELRTWLGEAIAILVGAGYQAPHALAVSRRRIIAALDVLGSGVARHRSDGVVLSVRDQAGRPREHVTNDLSRDGVLAAARVLAGNARPASVDLGQAPAPPRAPRPDPSVLSDAQLLARVGKLAARDRGLSSRIVYAAALLDIDDAQVWSVEPGRMLEQRIVRVRRSITRVAWHGTRPVAAEASHAWAGSVDAQDLDDEQIIATREDVLALPTPRAFDDDEHAYILDPAVAAALVDAAVAAMLTRDAMRRPEVAARLAAPRAGSPVLTIVDDPLANAAYGTRAFDDRGQPATARTLVERGQIVGHIDRACRPGHVGVARTAAAHLRVAPGDAQLDALVDAGFLLEGPMAVSVDPGSDRVVVQVARAREYQGGRRTGRMFADIELVGELGALLAGVRGVSAQTRSIGIRDEIDGHPLWRSVDAPWLAGTARLRQRRRPA
jgi:predicted Zn-dependent protease